MYEVNWRPGCPPAFYLELDVVINSIRYAMYLAKNQKQMKKKELINKNKNHNQKSSRNRLLLLREVLGKQHLKLF